MATPLVRRRAQELGIDLATVAGTGPGGRVVRADLEGDVRATAVPATTPPTGDGPRVEPVRGLRRRIAARLTKAWTEIPHITYVDAVDATELQTLRAVLNDRAAPGTARITLLPFVVRAIVIAAREHPRCNATFDPEAGMLAVHDAVHVGIATQTPDGLKVPVLRDAQSATLRESAIEIARLAEAARSGSITREELTGSTITVTSLGALGGLVTTPIINQPEVSVIGINKMEVRPVWRDGAFVPREMFNLSSSFDHRIIDGWDAAVFVQRIRELLEHPALLFVGDEASTPLQD